MGSDWGYGDVSQILLFENADRVLEISCEVASTGYKASCKERNVKHYNGIIPALITPFDDRDEINEPVLRQLVDLNIEKGAAGFYVCGSSAEAFLMSMEERKRVFEIVADQVSGSVSLICHVGCISTRGALELAEHAGELGADAISSIPPFYYKFSEEEIKQYYRDLMDHVDLPMIIYNFPDFSGVSLNSSNAADLFLDPRVMGIKHTSNDMFEIDKIKGLSDRLLVFSGYDEAWISALAMGADGAIGSTFNVMAEKAIAIQRLFGQGRLEEARATQTVVNRIIAELVEVGVFSGIKYLLELQGIDAGETRRPFSPLTEDQKRRMSGLLPLLSEEREVLHE
jgi:N-acetylneuraminate lyase